MKNIEPEITFKHGLQDGDEHDMQLRGYRNDVIVLLPTGQAYQLSFYDPFRITQEVKQIGLLVEKNLIVIEEITMAKIQQAVHKMWSDGFFEEI